MVALGERLRIAGLPSQQGAALVMAILILLILTVLGIYAVTTSTLETKIAGSERVLKEAFYAADGGTDYGRNVIELVLNNASLPSGANEYDDDGLTLLDEVLGVGSDWQDHSPGVAPDIGNCDTDIHVDRLKLVQPEGQAAGFGEAAGETQATVYYRIDSQSSGIANASGRIQIIYRRKVHN